MLLFLKSAGIMLLVNSVFGSVCLDGRTSEKKFRVFEEKVNWYSAALSCSQRGMNIAAIENQEEQNKLATFLEEYRINNANMRWWIGGTDLLKGEFVWFSTNETIKYKNYGKNEPSNWNNIEHCLEILVGRFVWINWNWNYQWNDDECTDNKSYVCEYYECSTSLK